jgi:hypothetical protein
MDERQSLLPIHSPLRIESQTFKAGKLGGEERMGGLEFRDGAPPYQFDQIALCLAFLRTDCLHVNVGRDSQTRVAQQLMCNFGFSPFGSSQTCAGNRPRYPTNHPTPFW